MGLTTEIKDGLGTGNKVQVTRRGQLVVAPLGYSEPYYVAMTSNNTAYNLTGPQTGKRFVITGFIISADKSVGSDGSLIEVYEADAEDSTTVTKTVMTLQMQEKDNLPITPLNLIITEGVWLNAKMDDNNVYLTAMGYYIEA